MNDMIDLFTRGEVRHARTILAAGGLVNKKLHDDVLTEDVMQRINEQTGQENNRRYMAYRLEYVAGTHPEVGQ